MIRALLAGALQRSAPILRGTQIYENAIKILPKINPLYTPSSTFSTVFTNQISIPLLSNQKIQNISENITRSVTKFSWGKGKRKTVKLVLQKFYRLDWGGWIHTKCGRNKKLWKKHAARKRRLRQHVFCNSTQNTLLDTMVNKYWRKPKYYVEDPYEPYHIREEHMYTYKKPKPFVRE